jgi:hypothetical protein
MQTETTRAASKPRAVAATSTAARARAPPTPKSPRAMFANDWASSEDMHGDYLDITNLLLTQPPMDQYKTLAAKYAKAVKMINDTPEEKKKRDNAIAYVIYDTVALNTTDSRNELIKKRFDESIESKRAAPAPKRGSRAATSRPIIAAEELIDDGDVPSDDALIASASNHVANNTSVDEPTEKVAKPRVRKPRATMTATATATATAAGAPAKPRARK